MRIHFILLSFFAQIIICSYTYMEGMDTGKSLSFVGTYQYPYPSTLVSLKINGGKSCLIYIDQFVAIIILYL